MLVRWSCGCVGLISENSRKLENHPLKDHDIVIKPCDGEYMWFRRNMGNKTYSPLDYHDETKLVLEMCELACDADNMRTVRRALQGKTA